MKKLSRGAGAIKVLQVAYMVARYGANRLPFLNAFRIARVMLCGLTFQVGGTTKHGIPGLSLNGG